MPITFNAQVINLELDSLNITYDPAQDIGLNLVEVHFSKSKQDHHDQNFYKAKQHYLSGQSLVAQIYLIGNYSLQLIPK